CSVSVTCDGTVPLLTVLRDHLGLRGTKFGCGTEQCGACMVLIDGKPEYSCSREAASVAGQSIATIEALSDGSALHALQQTFLDEGRVRVGSGKVEIGQGLLTALTQIAAEELDVRPDQIHLVSGETDISPAEGFTSGSYSVAVGGASIRLVCAEVRSLFLDRL